MPVLENVCVRKRLRISHQDTNSVVLLGRGICPLLSSPLPGIWQLKWLLPPRICLFCFYGWQILGWGEAGCRWNWLLHYVFTREKLFWHIWENSATNLLQCPHMLNLVMTEDLKRLILIQVTDQTLCCDSNNTVVSKSSIFVLYMTCLNFLHN